MMRQIFSGLYTPEPGVIDGILGITVIYALAVGPGRRQLAPKEPFERKRAGFFAAGVFLLILALATPLDQIGEKYLFSAHMTQHVLLMFFIPPLFILGTPVWLSDFLFRTEGLGKILKAMVHPVVACVLFNASLILWHFPAFYELALRDPLVHLLEHATFVVFSLAMFWVVLGRDSRSKEMHNGVKLLYILAVNIGQIPLFGALTFAGRPLYPTYAAAPRYIPGFDALADQVIGGVIMKITALVFMFIGLTVYFCRWYVSETRK